MDEYWENKPKKKSIKLKKNNYGQIFAVENEKNLPRKSDKRQKQCK